MTPFFFPHQSDIPGTVWLKRKLLGLLLIKLFQPCFPGCRSIEYPELHSEKQTTPGCPKSQLRAPGNTSPPGAQGWPRKYGLPGQHQRHFSAVQSCEGHEGERAEAG